MKKAPNKKANKPALICLAAVLLTLLSAGVLIALIGRSRLEKIAYPQKYTEYVEYYAGKYGMDPLLVYSFIRTESNFDPGADSHAGARGLMQITEVTFDWIKSKIAPTEELTFEDLYDPETNIRFGCYFISYCLKRYENDVATAAAAYHSGWGTVDSLLAQEDYTADGKTLQDFPYRNMRQYVKKITESYENYRYIYGTASDTTKG